MALRSGLAGQIGFGEETTWGTRVVPTRFLSFTDESIEKDINRIEGFGIRASAGASAGTVARSDRWAAGTSTVAGSIGFTKETGVTAEDVAKRLIDYGFHAPTLSRQWRSSR